ncbi:hypothetical protein [uncultured Modestobacter sp.]|uniref:hypothetical protein n=1 Tax=uncultured Modestobacter sp. TaxID=380048 RepID=UPI00260A00EF|nr:hypothetical protein [uncultured Modestobacter sp.]
MPGGNYLSRAERRALEANVAHLPVTEADRIVDRATSHPKWARDNGWTSPLPVETGRAVVRA